MAEERKLEDMALAAGGARQRLDELYKSGDLSTEEWAQQVRVLDRFVATAISNRWLLMYLA
jgi:hypothetical protein